MGRQCDCARVLEEHRISSRLQTRRTAIDTAKLCNRKLAREGYSAFRDYIFDEVKPDIIESHQTWTEASGFAAIPEAVRDYEPVLVDGVPFYVRKGFCPASRLKRISRDEFSRGARAFPYDEGIASVDRRSFDRFNNFYSFH